LLGQALEGWALEGPRDVSFHELPFPGIPLVLNLGSPWRVDGASLDSFLAGLHTRPSRVTGERAFSCLELRLTPLGARRLLGLPLHELANGTHALEDLLPGTGRLTARVRAAPDWGKRFDLLEAFLAKRLADTQPAPHELDWAWKQLVRSGGRARVGVLAAYLGWSPRRLIDRFRDHVGLPPKAAARVIRLDRAVSALRSGTPRIADVAATRTSAGSSASSAASRRVSSQPAISFKTKRWQPPRLAPSSTRGAAPWVSTRRSFRP
jgi:AraC-like DNA-binding protein